jgi:hypothetical protein
MTSIVSFGNSLYISAIRRRGAIKRLNALNPRSVTIRARNSAIRLLYIAVSTTIIAHIVIMARSFALWLNGLCNRYT